MAFKEGHWPRENELPIQEIIYISNTAPNVLRNAKALTPPFKETGYVEMAKTRSYFQQRLESVPGKRLKRAKGTKEKGTRVADHFGGPSRRSKTTRPSREPRNPRPDGVSVAPPTEILEQANI